MDARKSREARDFPAFGPLAMFVAVLVLAVFLSGSCSWLPESSEDAIRERVQEAREDAADKIGEKADELEDKVRGREEPEPEPPELGEEEQARRDVEKYLRDNGFKRAEPPEIQPDGTLVLDPANQQHVLDTIRHLNPQHTFEISDDPLLQLACYQSSGPGSFPLLIDGGENGTCAFGPAQILSLPKDAHQEACGAYNLAFRGIEAGMIVCGPGAQGPS